MRKGEALSLLAEEAIDKRNHLTDFESANWICVRELQNALETLGCLVNVSKSGVINVVAWGEDFE